MLAFFVSGIWHGAAWTFVIWGIGHGVLVSIFRINEKVVEVAFNRYIAAGLTFCGVLYLNLIFRVPDFETLIEFTTTMSGFNKIALPSSIWNVTSSNIFTINENNGGLLGTVGATRLDLICLILIAIITFLSKNVQELVDQKYSERYFVNYCVVVSVFSIFCLSRVDEFIYFQF